MDYVISGLIGIFLGLWLGGFVVKEAYVSHEAVVAHGCGHFEAEADNRAEFKWGAKP